MKYILGTKQKMSQIFDAQGNAHPVTVVSAGPVVVTQVKNKDTDGYDAVQVGYGTRRESRINKAQKGHFKELGNFAYTKEYRGEAEVAVGDTVDLSSFTEGDKVKVTAISKGKGFQGVVKRHGFGGGRRSHGQKHSEREPGSIGIGGVQRVFKGTRMAGRMGSDTISVKNLTIVKIDSENNQIFIGGAVPGKTGTLVEIIG